MGESRHSLIAVREARIARILVVAIITILIILIMGRWSRITRIGKGRSCGGNEIRINMRESPPPLTSTSLEEKREGERERESRRETTGKR